MEAGRDGMGAKVCWTLRNVLSCQFKDDIPTQLAAVGGLAHESQSPETLNDGIKADVNVLGIEDMRVKARLIRKSARIASWIQMRQEIFEVTRTQQHTDSQLVPMEIGVHLKSKGQDKDKGKVEKGKSDGMGARNESLKKAKDDDRRKCYCCRKTGHAKSQCKAGLNDLADAEEKPVTANSRLNSAAAVAPLADDHATTFPVTVPRVERKTSCACVRVETTTRSDVGGTAPTGTERVKLTSAISMCETCRMRDTCASGGIRPRGSRQTAQNDTTVVTMQSVTAPDDPAHGSVVESHFGSSKGRKFRVRYSEADVGFLILSAGEASQLDTGCQVMLPGPGKQITRTCARDPNVAKLEKNPESVLVARLGIRMHGWSTVVPEGQSGKVGRRGTANLCQAQQFHNM